MSEKDRFPEWGVTDVHHAYPYTHTDTDDQWMRHGNCHGLDAQLFFPESGETGAEAMAVCAGCPVQLECLRYAIANGEQHGIWGGRTTRQRNMLAGRVARATMATCVVVDLAAQRHRRTPQRKRRPYQSPPSSRPGGTA